MTGYNGSPGLYVGVVQFTISSTNGAVISGTDTWNFYPPGNGLTVSGPFQFTVTPVDSNSFLMDGTYTVPAPPPSSPGSGCVAHIQLALIRTGSVALSPNQINTTSSGLAYSRVSRTFNGTVTLTNVSSSPIGGPLQILFTKLTTGVTLANATGELSGSQYLTVTIASLAPGDSVTVGVQFQNPSYAAINFAPVIYTGTV
jgi:hypothetical protein